MANLAVSSSADIWHRRLGHCGTTTLDVRRKNKVIVSVRLVTDCVPCRLGKSHRLPFKLVEHSTIAPLQLFHSDV